MVRHFRRLAGYLGMRELRNRVSDDRSWFRGREEQGAAQSHRLPDPAGSGVACAHRFHCEMTLARNDPGRFFVDTCTIPRTGGCTRRTGELRTSHVCTVRAGDAGGPRRRPGRPRGRPGREDRPHRRRDQPDRGHAREARAPGPKRALRYPTQKLRNDAYHAVLSPAPRSGETATYHPLMTGCRKPCLTSRSRCADVRSAERTATIPRSPGTFTTRPANRPASPKVSPSRGAPVSLSGGRSRLDADVPMPWGIDGETLPMSRRCAPAHLTEAGVAVEVLPVHRQLEKTLMTVENGSYPEPVEFRSPCLSDALHRNHETLFPRARLANKGSATRKPVNF